MSTPYFIGIAGGSASGKTTVLNSLLANYSRAELVLISQDNYYKPREEQFVDERGVTNFDLPSAIDVNQFKNDLDLIRAGKPITKEEYTFNNASQKPQTITIAPAEVVIVEGLFVFHYETIDLMFDYRVYIDCPSELRLQRRIARDAKERGYPESDVRYRWEHHVRPADIDYLEPHKSRCDLIIDNPTNTPLDLSPLNNQIYQHIQRELL